MVQVRVMGDDPDRVKQVLGRLLPLIATSGTLIAGDPAELGMRGPGRRVTFEVLPASGTPQASGHRQLPIHRFRESLQNIMSLCQYNVRPFTQPEVEAIEEYDDQVSLAGYFELAPLLDGANNVADAFRCRAEELAGWYQALTALLVDPRLRNAHYDDPEASVRVTSTADSRSPYSPAVRRFLRDAAGCYHRHRHGYEYAVTVWALGLRLPAGYVPETRNLDLLARELTLWD